VLICFAFYNGILAYQKNGIQNLDLTLLLCNVAYFVLGIILQLGPNLITAMPVITTFLIPAGTDIISPLTNFFGNISYEFYIINFTMLMFPESSSLRCCRASCPV
jgi:hypothetical protein